MDIEIRKLTPELAEDYACFFDKTPHDDDVYEHKCYCVCWASADHSAGTDFSSREKRRELAIRYINSGIIQGYLAYLDGQIVGWCNANTKSDCLKCIGWLRNMTFVNEMESSSDIKVKSIYCFTIAPDMKRKGIATKLLERVCEDAANEGYNFIEVYPNKHSDNISKGFMGPLELYKRNGFVICQDVKNQYNDIFVMRKSLK